MPGITVSTLIDAPVGRVWEIVEPIERHVDWMADAVAIRFVNEQTRGTGTRFLCDTKIGPFTLVDEMTITSWEPNRAMGVMHTGVVTGTGEFTMSPEGDGRTRFTWEEDLKFPWWLGGPVGALIGGQVVLKLVWRRNLKRLKRLVESA